MKRRTVLASMFVLATTMIVILAACGGGGGGGGSSGGIGVHVDFFTNNGWYDVFGNYCGSHAGPGCNYYSDGRKIEIFNDPYYSSYPMGGWYIYENFFGDPRYESPNGIIYDYFGYALNASDNQNEGSDTFANAAEKEQAVVKEVGTQFAAKWNLSNEVGVRVAKILNDWALIGKNRARTERDLADITGKLYGVDFNKVKKAAVEFAGGKQESLKSLVNESAEFWNTDPETMKEILKSFYKDQLKTLE